VAGAWRAELLPPSPYQATYTPDMPIIGFAFDGQAGVHAHMTATFRQRLGVTPSALRGANPARS
jgi:hypothetical protein